MWLNSRDVDDADGSASDRANVWAFSGADSAEGLASSAGGSWPAATSAARLLWNRTEPAEEEREEEALPSYLSYLQQQPLRAGVPTRTRSFQNGAMTSSSSGYSQSVSSPGRAMSPPGLAPPVSSSAGRTASVSSVGSTQSDIEERSKDLAFALQDFIVAQMRQQLVSNGGPTAPRTPTGHQGPPLPPRTPTASSCGCNCESLRVRVSELTHQVHALQGQVTGLLKSTGPSLNSTAQAYVPGGPMPPMPPMAMPPPHHPPIPPPSPPAGSALIDRVSTLEGRQSAFQSQLAQIAKVLGVPAGKQSKNSQVKTLVQTLHDEIDAKVYSVATQLESTVVTNVLDQLKNDTLKLAREEIDAIVRDSAAELVTPPTNSLSVDAVLTALSSEHEASLSKLSSAFQDLVAQEGKQRKQLEQRIESHLSQQEEWLQQLEGELGSRFERQVEAAPISSTSRAQSPAEWTAALEAMNQKLTGLEAACNENRVQWRKLLPKLTAPGSAMNS